MNTQKIQSRKRAYGLLNASSFVLTNPLCENLGSKPTWSTTALPLRSMLPDCSPQQYNFDASGGISQWQGAMAPASLPSSGSNRIELTPAAFFATERLLGLPQLDYQLGPPPVLSHLPKNSLAISSTEPLKQNDVVSHPRDTLGSVMKLRLLENENSQIFHDINRYHCRNSHETDLQSFGQSNRAAVDGTNAGTMHLTSANGMRSPSAAYDPLKSLVKASRFQLQLENIQPRISPVTSTNVSSGSSAPSKTRIRWTTDLHDQFVECVNCLGGAEKATPKGILKLMDSEGLTIYHIKSHLQKYRTAKCIPESPEGKFERRTSIIDTPQLDSKTGTQITEALRLQLEVQRRLHEQLEVQRSLQMRIEAQGRRLQKMFEEQLKTNPNYMEAQNLDALFPDVLVPPPEDCQVSCIEGSS